ncbi:MAG: radical SAM protein [Pseudomonadota bacterium]
MGDADIVLLSCYLQHFRTVTEIGKIAAKKGVPVLVGGPVFNIPGTADAWRRLPGVSAVVGAESDLSVSDLVAAVIAKRDLLEFPGVVLPDGRASSSAPPLRQLDDVPMADFTDYPWDRYPVRIVPIMTGRGCQWNKCAFCSDVISVNGRSFRTRSIQNVLLEMQEQSRIHSTTNFLFVDLKLNSYPDMIRGIAENVQSYVPGAEWLGTVHVDLRDDNGLSRHDLKNAVRSGMRRVSFGLESGSQRMLDLMDKGSNVERNSQFIREAHEAGLSLRCTMFKGFPGERADDMAATADFLEEHAPYLDRVRFNEFTLMEDTPIYHELIATNAATRQAYIRRFDHFAARASYSNPESGDRVYRREKARALSAVYEINRRPLRAAARQFDGLM